MIFPKKHIELSESLFGLGSFILSILKKPLEVDEVWSKLSKSIETKEYPCYHSFDNMILALDFLYIIGAVKLGQNGKIYSEAN